MDKNKLLDSAAKLVAKGAYDKAIKEYQRVLEADPKDVRVLQKLGELFQKKNDNTQASHYFTRVAESYSSDGFFLKAVALYKQVLKISPDLVEVNMKLAELHQQLGLMSEATAYFQTVANQYEKAGDTKRSLDVLQKMVDLDPENVASRVKLAELYVRERMNSEASGEFKKAAAYLKKNNRIDDYLRVAERIAALEPNDLALSLELASLYLGQGDHKRALAKLQVCFKANPKDVETLLLLAQAFEGMGQVSKAISVHKELIKVFAEARRSEEVAKTWSKIERLDPNDPDLLAQRPGRAVPAASAPPPSRPPAASPQPAPKTALGKDQLSKLLTETDVYVKYGLHDKALDHLRKIFAVDPENLDAHEKAYYIYENAGNEAQAHEQLLNVLRLCTRRKEVERAKPFLVVMLQNNPRHPEVAAFTAVLGTPEAVESEAVVESEAIPDEEILSASTEEELVVGEEPDNSLVDESEDLAVQSASHDDDEVVSDAQIVLEEESGSDSPELLAEPEEEGEVLETEAVEESLQAEDGEIVLEDEVAPSGDEPFVSAGSDTYGDEPDPAAGEREALEEASPIEGELEEHDTAVSDLPSQVVAAEGEDSADAPAEEELAVEECEEAAFFLDQGLLDEAREILETVLIAYPGHARATALMARLEDGPGVVEGTTEEPSASPAPPAVSFAPGESDAFDLAAELAEELGEVDESAGAAPMDAGEDFQYSVEEVFSEFKKGLQKVVKPEDVDTHYDLGIAYKEMGLIDDAISEFAVAREGCRSSKKEIDCLTMTAMLRAMKGEHALAVEAYKEALGSQHAVGDVLKATEFELAAAWEAAGSPGKALYHYQLVSKLDPAYRDVGKACARLSAVTKPEEDGTASASAKKAAAAAPPGPNGGTGPRAAPAPKAAGGQAGAKPGTGAPGVKSRKAGYV